MKEIDRLEHSLATLATVGSTSPYVGLFAAIPAVVAYNRFADQVGRLEIRFDAFMEEFSSILQRHAGRGGAPAAGSTAAGAAAAGHGATGMHAGTQLG